MSYSNLKIGLQIAKGRNYQITKGKNEAKKQTNAINKILEKVLIVSWCCPGSKIEF